MDFADILCIEISPMQIFGIFMEVSQMEHSESERRVRIAAIVALVTVLCALCALALVLTRDNGQIAFNTAQLVLAWEAHNLPL